MSEWTCNVCGWVYDQASGDPAGGVPPGTRFEDVSVDWRCPECGAARDQFALMED